MHNLPRLLMRCKLGILPAVLAVLGGCSTVLAPEPLKHSPNFEPVFPKVETSPEVPTGAIYGGKQSESWFGKGRNYQVGDVITVSGKVTGKREEGGQKLVDLEVKCTNQNGQDTLQGDATVALN